MNWLAVVASILCVLIGINIGVRFMSGLQVTRRQVQESAEVQLRAQIRELEAKQSPPPPQTRREG